MRNLRVRISPDVVANIKIHEAHLDILKKILQLDTDKGFFSCMKNYVRNNIKETNPHIIKANLEHNFKATMMYLSSQALESLFEVPDDDEFKEFLDGIEDIPATLDMPSESTVINFRTE